MITCRRSADVGLEEKVAKLNPLIRGWRDYFQHGNSVNHGAGTGTHYRERQARSAYQGERAILSGNLSGA